MRPVYAIIITIFLFASIAFADVIGDRIAISSALYCQSFTQTVYNTTEDEYLVVWEDNRDYENTNSDIYGQIVSGDGTLRGENFAVCKDSANQWWPHLDYDPITNRYLVVFSDNRNAETEDWYDNYDIYAALLDKDGKHIETAFTEDDTTFAVCTDTSAVHYPDVSYNSATGTFLAVWADYRNATQNGFSNDIGDIYGQIIDANGEFIIPTDRAQNLEICTDDWIWFDVPVVTYSGQINEWLVVFAKSVDWMPGDVLAQRVSYYGALRNQEGGDEAGPIVIKEDTGLQNDPMQPRACFNYELDNSLAKTNLYNPYCECLITWRGDEYPDYNLYAQRLAFTPDSMAVKMGLKPEPGPDSLNYAYLMNTDGDPEQDSQFDLCTELMPQNAPDIAWSTYDNEFFMHWEDSRNGEEVDYWIYDSDEYAQRLFIDTDSSLVRLDQNRDAMAEEDMNFEYDVNPDEHIGGNLVGVAHNSYRNEYLAVYAVQDSSLEEDRGNELVGRIIKGTMPVKVEGDKTTQPTSFVLGQNYPNPFNPSTSIDYELNQPGQVRIDVYDITGKHVRSLWSGYRPAGSHLVQWNGLTDDSRQAASGVYFYKLECNGESQVNKMTLIK